MKVNLSLEVTDEQRNVLACILAGKPLKALAKREDVRDFVEGWIATLTPDAIPDAPEKPAKAPNTAAYDIGDGRTVVVENGPGVGDRYAEAFIAALTPDERKIYDQLKEDGKPDGYIRGYFYIERKRARGDKPLADKG